MATPTPKTMRAWQYTSTSGGGLSKNLHLNPSVPTPTPLLPSQNLIRVLAVALNPIDYKPAEIPIVGRVMISKPATPGIDFSGVVVVPATDGGGKGEDEGENGEEKKESARRGFEKGQLVFGVSSGSPLAGGALAEFILVESKKLVRVPEGVDPVEAATVGVAGLTALQSVVGRLKPDVHIKNGSASGEEEDGERQKKRIFINGGSGGTGVFGIQIAKAMGWNVTTTCSGRNVDLCRSLGADTVIDYTKGGLVEALVAASKEAGGDNNNNGGGFDHAVDNVGTDKTLWWRSAEYLRPGAVYSMVGGAPSIAHVTDSLKRKVVPRFLGGVKRRVEGFWPDANAADLERIGEWMREGKVRAVIDQKFAFEEAPRAFEKLKSGRARGKIVVDVASETYKTALLA